MRKTIHSRYTQCKQEGFSPVIVLIIMALVALVVGILVINPWQTKQSVTKQKTTNATQPVQQATTAKENKKEESGLVWSYDQEVEFDGSNKLVEVEKAALEKIAGLKQGTVSLWFKFKKSQEKEFLPILYLGKGKGKNIASNWVIEIGHFDHSDSPNTRLYYTFYNDKFEPFLCFDTGENLIPDTWYHFVGVNSEKGNTGYLNGKELTNRHYNFSNAKDIRFVTDVPIKDVFYLGYGWFGVDQKWHYFNGAIKDVKIYNRALNGQEVTQL